MLSRAVTVATLTPNRLLQQEQQHHQHRHLCCHLQDRAVRVELMRRATACLRYIDDKVQEIPETQKKAWISRRLLAFVETLDDTIPFVGPFMDLPEVDAIERRIVDEVVDSVWAAAKRCAAERPEKKGNVIQ